MKELIVWAGPVSSGKSSRALNYAARLARTGAVVTLIRPPSSRRDHEKPGILQTKAGHTWPSKEVQRASDIIRSIPDDTDVVWIDEPMFFDEEPQVYDVVQRLREHYIILVSGLPATSELEPFGTSFPRIMAVADEIVWCKADCDTSGRMNAATRSICLVPKTGQKLVGGEEKYRPVIPEVWTRWRQGLSVKKEEFEPVED